nr:venom protein U-MPTX.22-Mc25 [Megalopyge crispata]
MAPSLPLLALIVTVFSQCGAVQLDKCGIVRELRRHGFPEAQLRDWTCLVQSESSGRTDVIGPPNSDGSRDHGLFQINDRYWCNDSDVPGKECKVTCAELRTDDISKAVACIWKIFQVHNFNAWYGWVNKCQGWKPDITEC